MAETAETIRSKNVDGGVETVLLDLVARVKELEARPTALIPDEYVMRYPDGQVVTFVQRIP